MRGGVGCLRLRPGCYPPVYDRLVPTQFVGDNSQGCGGKELTQLGAALL